MIAARVLAVAMAVNASAYCPHDCRKDAHRPGLCPADAWLLEFRRYSCALPFTSGARPAAALCETCHRAPASAIWKDRDADWKSG